MAFTDLLNGQHSDRTSLTERAYRELEERLVTLKLEPGSLLSEGTLSKTLGIGRTPIREALQLLAIQGLIIVVPRRGILVSEIDLKTQLELLRVRREVERLMVRLAATRASPAEREVFNALAERLGQTGLEDDETGFMRADGAFNRTLATSCRNEIAIRAMSLMMGLSRRFWYMHNKQAHDMELSAKLHSDLAAAIGRGDADEAALACDRHLDYLEAATKQALEKAR